MATRPDDQFTQADCEFVITRVLNAPRARVFNAWTDPEQMVKWWGPHSVTNSLCDLDLRPGGRYRIVMCGPDGTEYPVKGVFREIRPPAQLVMTMDASEHPKEWHDLVKPGRTDRERNPAGEMLDTVVFEDLGPKTRLTIRTQFESPQIRDAMMRIGMTDGWAQSLERLADVVHTDSAGQRAY